MRNTGASAAGAGGSGTGQVADGRRSRRASRRPAPLSPAGRGDRVVELLGDRGPHGRDRVVGHARPNGGTACGRAAGHAPPTPDFLRRSVALGVALVVAVPAVGRGLDDDGPAPARVSSTETLHRERGRDDVVAVDRRRTDAVAGGAPLERRRVLLVGGRELGVAVVLAEEDDRQLPDRGQVHRLVERALRDRAVAEERDRDRGRRRAAARRRPRPPRSAGPRPRCRWRRRCRASGRRCASSRRGRGSCPRPCPSARRTCRARSSPFARQWPWPRCVDVITSSGGAASTRRRPRPPARSTGARSPGPRRRGRARPPAARTRGSRASAGASRGARPRRTWTA